MIDKEVKKVKELGEGPIQSDDAMWWWEKLYDKCEYLRKKKD